MKLTTRHRLLALARFLERRAKGLRRYVRAKTPRRQRRQTDMTGVLRDEIAARRLEDYRDEQAELRQARGEEA